MDPLTYEVIHAVVGYTFKGEYCGDFELDPTTIMKAKRDHDFTQVYKRWPAHTFIPEKMPLDCN